MLFQYNGGHKFHKMNQMPKTVTKMKILSMNQKNKITKLKSIINNKYHGDFRLNFWTTIIEKNGYLLLMYRQEIVNQTQKSGVVEKEHQNEEMTTLREINIARFK